MNTSARGLARVGLSILAAGLAATMLAAPAFAARGGTPGAPTGETLGNNLSVPAIFVGDMTLAPALRLPCDAVPQAPGDDGVPSSTVYPGYWLQKTEAVWSASCTTAENGVSVLADWGDNLTNDEVGIKAGKTIRVEIALVDSTGTTSTGYQVDKLEPEQLDRLSPYGTTGAPQAMTARAWDTAAHLTITEVGVPTPVYDGDATAEINSAGGIVYGFNWGQKGAFPPPGDYVIEFTVSDGTTFDGTVDTTDRATTTDHAATLAVTLLPKSGGGNGGDSGDHGNPNR